MNNKHVFWIDDYPYGIQAMAKKIYPKLWDEGINSTVLFLGDYYKGNKNDPDFEETDFDETIDLLTEYAFTKCKFERKDNDKNLFKGDTTLYICDSLKKLDCELVKPILDEDIKSDYKGLEVSIDKLVEKINDIIENRISVTKCKVVVVAIDMMLIFGDSIRLNEHKAILSAYLYGKLKEKNRACLLYSAYSYQSEWIDSWKKSYSERFEGSISDVEPYIRENTEELLKAIDSLGGESIAE